MNKLGLILAVFGLVVLLLGAAQPVTKDVQSCYDYQSTYGDSTGCVETTVPNPFPKTLAMMFGFFLTIGGAGHAISGSSEGGGQSGGSNGSIRKTSGGEKTLAEKLEERQNE